MDPNQPQKPTPAPELSTFDEIRAHPKMIDSYTDNERKVIVDSKDQWDDEEKFAFEPLLMRSEAAAIEDEGTQLGTPAPETPAPAETPKPEEKPTEPPKPEATPFSFGSKEEMDAYIQKQIDERAEPKTPEEKTAEEDKKEPQKYFTEDWKPKDANELADAMIKNPLFAQALKQVLAPEIIKDYQEMTNTQRQAVRDFNSEMDNQYNQLSQEHGLPSLSTPEGQEVNKKIATIALKFGKDNYLDAWELYESIPEDKGGGYKLPTTPEVDPAKETLKIQKAAASLVGGGSSTGGAEGGKPQPGAPMDWKSLHGTKQSDLIAKRLAS